MSCYLGTYLPSPPFARPRNSGWDMGGGGGMGMGMRMRGDEVAGREFKCWEVGVLCV